MSAGSKRSKFVVIKWEELKKRTTNSHMMRTDNEQKKTQGLYTQTQTNQTGAEAIQINLTDLTNQSNWDNKLVVGIYEQRKLG